LAKESEFDSNFEIEFRLFLNGRCTTQENIKSKVVKFVETFEGEKNLKGLINFTHLVKDIDPKKFRKKAHFWSKTDY
jgi:hypothetical protein